MRGLVNTPKGERSQRWIIRRWNILRWKPLEPRWFRGGAFNLWSNLWSGHYSKIDVPVTDPAASATDIVVRSFGWLNAIVRCIILWRQLFHQKAGSFWLPVKRSFSLLIGILLHFQWTVYFVFFFHFSNKICSLCISDCLSSLCWKLTCCLTELN